MTLNHERDDDLRKKLAEEQLFDAYLTIINMVRNQSRYNRLPTSENNNLNF